MATVGSCGKAHGIRGEIAVFTQMPEVFQPGTEVSTDRGAVLTVVSARRHKGHLIVSFEGIADRNAAELMRNLQLSMEADHRPPLDADEFWVSDLIGLEVQGPDGAQLGIVSAVITTEVQDRLVVDTGHSQVEVPFVPELVPEVLATHIIVDPPEGLFGGDS